MASDLDAGKAELDRQKTLNERLEQDLLNIHKSDDLWNPDEVPQESGDADLTPGEPEAVGPTNDKIMNGPIPFAPSAETSILPIVTSQRDRFRQRNAELEEVRLLPCLLQV